MPLPTRITFISSRVSNKLRRMPWDFTHFLLPAALASALATLAALAALEVATAAARLPGLALASLQEAGTLALG